MVTSAAVPNAVGTLHKVFMTEGLLLHSTAYAWCNCLPCGMCGAGGRLASITVEASGSGGNSSQPKVMTSCSWSEDRSTEAAFVLEVLNSVELQCRTW